ncbi:DNA-cytosine methyltransferase [Rhodovulum sp. PH10]|nr:DNA-cytosine methyltransferase [Rhodovulum sp. PH10]
MARADATETLVSPERVGTMEDRFGVRMRIAGLFAGIGGFEAGLHEAGHETALLCEIWPPAAAVLTARFPDIRCVADIGALDALPKDIDLVTAGFPCQDLSQAGRTAGIGGQKSGLVDHVFRLLDKDRPPRVLLENVSFMLQLDRGSAMDRLVTAFEARGYRWAYRVVNSLAFLPQRRERVFLLASRVDDPANVLLADEALPTLPDTALDTHAHGFYWTEGIRGLGWGPDCVPTLKNGSTVGIPSPPAILLPDGTIVTPDLRDAERLQGFAAGWTEPATRAGRASLRWSLVGNAVTRPVAAWIGTRLAAPGRYDLARDGAVLEAGTRWPRAARFDGFARRAVAISAFPVWLSRPSLHAFLSHPGVPLSERATAGFLSRIERSRLRFVPGFHERVRAHLARMREKSPQRSREARRLLAAE